MLSQSTKRRCIKGPFPPGKEKKKLLIKLLISQNHETQCQDLLLVQKFDSFLLQS